MDGVTLRLYFLTIVDGTGPALARIPHTVRSPKGGLVVVAGYSVLFAVLHGTVAGQQHCSAPRLA